MLYTIFDIESNGLIRTVQDGPIKRVIYPEVLEVGYIQINEYLDILRGGSFYFYKPDWKLQQSALNVNGLSEAILAEHESEFDDSIVKLWTIMEQGRLIGKNSDKFDIPVCIEMLDKYGSHVGRPTILQKIDMQKVWAPTYRELIKEFTGRVVTNSGTLEEYVVLLGLKPEQIKEKFEEVFPEESRSQAHGALYDAFMTYIVTKDAVSRGLIKLEVDE